MEGMVVSIRGQQAEIDVRGKRMRAKLSELRVLAPASTPGRHAPAKVRVNVDLKPREGLLSELNVIGCTVDQAIDRVSAFLDRRSSPISRRSASSTATAPVSCARASPRF